MYISLCSAVFGEEIWPAAEYGRTMYTIRQRIGPLLMKMEKRYGMQFMQFMQIMVVWMFVKIHVVFKWDAGKIEDGGELTEKEIIRAERNSGVISNTVREIQVSSMINEAKWNKFADMIEFLNIEKLICRCKITCGRRNGRSAGRKTLVKV